MRRVLLAAAGALLVFAVWIHATTAVPHLIGDLEEIHVRPRLLGAVALALHVGTFALGGLAAVVLSSAFLRGAAAALRIPLFVIAATCIALGCFAFAATRNPHTAGYALMGILIAAGAAMRDA